MKLTVIRDDGLVAVDGLAYQGIDVSSLDENIHAIQWSGENGEVEYKPDEEGRVFVAAIDNIDFAQAVVAEWQKTHAEATRPPTEEELQSLCKSKARHLLERSDWAVLPDVAISNRQEFEAYRTSLRALYFNPVPEPEFPQEPKAVWIQ
jgi:hypothetical protein